MPCGNYSSVNWKQMETVDYAKSPFKTMEEDGIITRTVYPEVPPHVEYALSETGESMRPILNAMQEWGTNYKESFQ